MLPYHWDDRHKYYEDYLYLIEVYENYLEILSEQLDKIHNQDMGKEFWRILAGPALYTILAHLLDRWNIAKTITSSAEFDYFHWIDFPWSKFIPNTTADIDPDCNDYNHFLISSALFSLGVSTDKAIKVLYESKKNKDEEASKVAAHLSVIASPIELIRCIKKIIINAIKKSGITRLNRVLIVNSYLPKYYEFLLNILCINFPTPIKASRISVVKENIDLRANFNCDLDRKDPFLNFASSLIPKLIPKYL